MKFIIGEKIKEKVEERGVTQKAFASAIGMTTRNLERFFERSDISVNQLLKASDFLNYDFVTMYLQNSPHGRNVPVLKNDSSNTEGTSSRGTEISIQINLSGQANALAKNFPEFLLKMKKEAEERGLHLV